MRIELDSLEHEPDDEGAFNVEGRNGEARVLLGVARDGQRREGRHRRRV
jgi:hypothetical protein